MSDVCDSVRLRRIQSNLVAYSTLKWSIGASCIEAVETLDSGHSTMGRKYSCVPVVRALLMNTNICLKCECNALNALTRRLLCLIKRNYLTLKPRFLHLPGDHSEAAKTPKIRLRVGLRPEPRWGAYDAPSNLLSHFRDSSPESSSHYPK